MSQKHTTAWSRGGDVKERPIIFSAPMVRAILAGKKTQTRRIVRGRNPLTHAVTSPCPYGEAGDRLWLRETWGQTEWGEEWGYWRGKPDERRPVLYRADDPTGGADDEYWRPSIFMPRWASRITLRVTEVRVERVQEISAEDARAEGISVPRCSCEACYRSPSAICTADRTSYFEAFRDLWESINAKRAPWASNPWVWVVSFEKEQRSTR